MGGAALHLGNIAEMKTGEGKTLVATLAAYLNAIPGRGVHVVTVNDYLAGYQSELMGRIYRALGMTIGCILTGQEPDVRRSQYACDITYGTNNEFGFDYLRDNMALTKQDLVQRGHYFAIVDEVDSILIDEARTPLIISGPASADVNRWFGVFAKLVQNLKIDEDYEIDEKKRTVAVLEQGIEKVEDYLGINNLYETANTPLISFLNNAVRAKELFRRDKDYVVTNGEVLIVDEHTGRILPGRRYNEGLHQAIEAKENVTIKAENQTLASITLQNYFRMYNKLSGMTGTAETEAAEFMSTYKLGVVPIPTNKPMIRKDQSDLIYKNEEAKFKMVVVDIMERHKIGQPILLTDDLMRLFNSQAAASLMNRSSVPDDQAIESKMVSRAIASAQSQVEARNAEIRKNILKYDDVMNRQREAIYADRRQILEGEDISKTFDAFLAEVIADNIQRNLTETSATDWDLDSLWNQLRGIYPISLEIAEVIAEAGSRAKLTSRFLVDEITSDARIAYVNRSKQIGEPLMRELERRVMLSVIDRKWRDHLYEMDYLKEGIGLRAMAQRDPLVEYQREGYAMFQEMMAGIREEAVQLMFNLEVKQNVPDIAQQQPQQLTYSAPSEQGDAEVQGEAEQGSANNPPKQGGQGSAFFRN